MKNQERTQKVDNAFEDWLNHMTWWKTIKLAGWVCTGAIMLLFAMGLVIGIPLWGLYMLFFEVL